MKLYAPSYYKEFICIADKCSHSCCIGWEIDVDAVTLEKYQKTEHIYGKEIIQSIDMEETPHFKLSCGERCPHLTQSGLCKIILNVGEEFLCDICREHPRFYNNAGEYKEVGLGMACEEACRLIFENEKYNDFYVVYEDDEEPDNSLFCPKHLRDKVYSILSNSSISYPERLNLICKEFNVTPASVNHDEWMEIISSLEYLDESHKALFLSYSSEINSSKWDVYLERALAYYIFRHCTEVEDEEDFRIALSFCMFCERLLASILQFKNVNNLEEIIPLAVTVSEEIEYSVDNTEEIKFQLSIS